MTNDTSHKHHNYTLIYIKKYYQYYSYKHYNYLVSYIKKYDQCYFPCNTKLYIKKHDQSYLHKHPNYAPSYIKSMIIVDKHNFPSMDKVILKKVCYSTSVLVIH